MKNNRHYIATWFYKESKDEASFYPQLGRKGDSSLVHSVYMQIQVPFFTTFKHFNPSSLFLFFTNIHKEELPQYLQDMFKALNIEVITLPYNKRPPRNWHNAWQNQFYLYDILEYMGSRMDDYDSLLICDADCICSKPLDGLFDITEKCGSALYEFITDRTAQINGITLEGMSTFYEKCFQEKPSTPITYYGGEFMAFRGDIIKRINDLYPDVWKFNLECSERNIPKLNEEAHLISIMAEKLKIRNSHANTYVKRMWTSPQFNNINPNDAEYPVWHLPYEKKRGLKYLFNFFMKEQFVVRSENDFIKKAKYFTGIPVITFSKKILDHLTTLFQKIVR